MGDEIGIKFRELTIEERLERAKPKPIETSGQGGGIHNTSRENIYWNITQGVEFPSMRKGKQNGR